jgi:5'-nucleotidase (lipoprotein e(P4) family)
MSQKALTPGAEISGAARRAVAIAVLAAALASAGCAVATRSAPAAAGTASSPAAPRPSAARLPGALQWMLTSAEYRASTRQVYRVAAERLDELAPALPSGEWGVILDADETVLDNSEYAVRRSRVDSAYDEPSWTAWVKEEAAGAVPGAVAFTRRVHALGGRVAIVTNRDDAVCPETRANLRKVGVDADVVLCMPPGQEDKNPRFARLENGTAWPGIPPLTVLEWLGDNIQDFPGMTQAAARDTAAFALFGRRYFVLPNPTYGSWQAESGR